MKRLSLNLTSLSLIALMLTACDQNQNDSEENNPNTMTNPKLEIPAGAVYCISGLTYLILEDGDDSSRPGPEDIVHAIIRNTDDTSEDQEHKNKVQILHLDQLGEGVSEAFQIMTPTQKMRIWVPPTIQKEKGKDTLIYDIELVRFERTKEPPSIPDHLKSPRSK